MVDYETFCRIRDHLGRQQLTVAQTARALALSPHTVAKWAAVDQFRVRAGVPRASKLDAFKGQIVRWLDAHPYSAQQIFQRLGEAGYAGGISIVKDYVQRIRPRHQEAFLKLDFAPGECAQVDWGEFGTIGVGATRRRLSFFLMVLCYSRRMYLEFTVSQQMEFFLACHENAFAAFAGVPRRLMVDNLKSAVLQRLVGAAPVFNPKYLDFSRHWGFEISPCNVRAGNEKGRVENGVGFVKKNLLAGLELPDFAALQPAAAVWVDTVANVRVHRETHQRPIDRFEDERAQLSPLNPAGFDLARVCVVRATKQFRVPLDSNRYTVPSRYAGQRLTLKAYADRVCIYDGEQLVARHVRRMDRHKDIEDPDHERQLLAQRASAREQRLVVSFLALSPRAQAYREGLEAKRVNARVHLRKILALAELHGTEAVARALDDGLELQAFSAEYIANILGARRRIGPEPAALSLTRRADLLELELPEPDLSIYDRPLSVND
jgi:transposase